MSSNDINEHHTLNKFKKCRGNEDADYVLKYCGIKQLKWRSQVMASNDYYGLRTNTITKFLDYPS